MGTLFEQPERRRFSVQPDDIRDFIESAKQIAHGSHCSVTEVLAAARILEMRRANDIAVDNGNVVDELAAGFGELLQEAVRLATVWPAADD